MNSIAMPSIADFVSHMLKEHREAKKTVLGRPDGPALGKGSESEPQTKMKASPNRNIHLALEGESSPSFVQVSNPGARPIITSRMTN